MDKTPDFRSLYFILGSMAIILILTGIFMDSILAIFSYSAPKTFLLVSKIAFILSGIGDFVLLFYAKKKLS